MINFWFFEKFDLLVWIWWTRQKYNRKYRVYCFFLTPIIQFFLTQIHIHNRLMAVFFTFFYQIHLNLMAKSHLISGQKFEIMLDIIIGAFWAIWLDIVLNTSIFEALRPSFRIKIKNRNGAWYYRRILGCTFWKNENTLEKFSGQKV